jgi:hypothetical protein
VTRADQLRLAAGVGGALIVFNAVVLLSRLSSGTTSTASWELFTAVALGIALALQPVRRPGQKKALTFASFFEFVLQTAALFVAGKVFMLLFSVTFLTYGLRGLVTGRISLTGKIGPVREYTGIAAYFRAAWCIVFGATGITLAFLFL